MCNYSLQIPFFAVRLETVVNTSSTIDLASINEQAVIRCDARGYPPPVVNWLKDGNIISTNKSSDVYQVFVKTTPTTFLDWISTILYVNPDVSHSQFANYTCNATKLKDTEGTLETVEIFCKHDRQLNSLFSY